MKNTILIIAMAMMPVLLFSQAAQHKTNLAGAGMVREVSFSDIPAFVSFQSGSEIDASKYEQLIKSISSDKALGLIFLDAVNDKLGMTHFRYRQTYQGIPIENTQYIFHTKNNKIGSMNGCLLSKPDVEGSFSLSPEQAVQKALGAIQAEQFIFELPVEMQIAGFASYKLPVAEKVYYPKGGRPESNQLHAAYKVDVYAWKPYSRQWVYIDAISGKVLGTENRLLSTDVPGTAYTAYSGTRTITTDYTGGTYHLRESGRGDGINTYNCQLTTNYGGAIDFTDSDNSWNNVNAQLDQYATDAHFATERTYDYYYQVHGRNSIDNYGFQLNSYVHFNLVEQGYSNNVNAFWNGECMTYGDGDETRTPLTTVDICGHEITHGLTSYTAALNYQDESGALNEAFSDIFGTVIEFYAAPDYADWTIGEDIAYPFRSVSDPKLYGLPDTYHGENWYFESGDHGGVHRNCGPLSYWFYLISEGGSGTNDLGHDYSITGLGMDAAADIAFRLLTVYLTNTSNYMDARFYAIQATIDYYGACSEEVEQVTNAFYAIGVGGEYVPTVVADFTADYTQNCDVPFTVKFLNYSINGSTFEWNFGDGSTSTEVNPQHTYTTAGTFTVSLLADGGTCGSDTEIKTDYISINSELPCLTLMPTSGSISSTHCQGTLYDSGGPLNPYNDNTYSTFTISPPGATQVMLTINQFDIEPGSGSSCDYDYIAFYDGSSTSAPLINNTYYCNTNGNPGSITSSGGSITIVFSSDVGLALQGFEIEWQCVQENGVPYAAFTADHTNTCNGRVQFENQSINNPETYHWDFGDGGTSDFEHPFHLYNQSGTFTVSLYVTNSFGNNTCLKEDYITVLLDNAPAVETATVCIDSLFTLTAGSNPNTHWYADPNCSDVVHTGNTWEHQPIPDDTQYWVKTFDETASYYVGEDQSNLGGGYFGNPDYIHYLVFDAYIPFTILSVEVNADGAGVRQFALRDASLNTLQTLSVYCPNGVNRVDLNLAVPTGNDLQLVGMGSPNLFRTNEQSYLSFPYTIANVCSIKRSSATQNPTGYYYYFYDWEIETQACESAAAMLQINAINCSTAVNSTHLEQAISLHPVPANNELFISGLASNETWAVSITDLNGRLLSHEFIYDGKPININGLKSGAYLLKIQGAESVLYRRFIKM